MCMTANLSVRVNKSGSTGPNTVLKTWFSDQGSGVTLYRYVDPEGNMRDYEKRAQGAKGVILHCNASPAFRPMRCILFVLPIASGLRLSPRADPRMGANARGSCLG